MGCHTWFARPVTKDEFKIFKNNAIADAWNLFGNTEDNRKYNCVELIEYCRVKNSVQNNTDYWWIHGFGTRIIDGLTEKSEYTYVKNGVLYLDLSRPCCPIFENLKRYHNVFRVNNYPIKTIHSRKELRKWMGKNYFDLEEWQLNKISEFFRENPGGIITFG